MSALRAYMVSDDEHSVIEFSEHAVVARRNGANELGTDFEVVSCRRAHYADPYAEQGWVPPQVLLANGWWMGCRHCGNQVWEDGEDEDGTRTNTSVWPNDDDPAHLLLWHILAAAPTPGASDGKGGGV